MDKHYLRNINKKIKKALKKAFERTTRKWFGVFDRVA